MQERGTYTSAHSKEEVRGRVMQKENIDAARSQYGFLEIKRSKWRGASQARTFNLFKAKYSFIQAIYILGGRKRFCKVKHIWRNQVAQFSRKKKARMG